MEWNDYLLQSLQDYGLSELFSVDETWHSLFYLEYPKHGRDIRVNQVNLKNCTIPTGASILLKHMAPCIAEIREGPDKGSSLLFLDLFRYLKKVGRFTVLFTGRAMMVDTRKDPFDEETKV